MWISWQIKPSQRKNAQLRVSRSMYFYLLAYQLHKFLKKWKNPNVGWSGGRAVLPYITYTGMCRPTGLWFWSSWFRKGYPFQRRFLERGIKNCGSRLYLLLKIVADYEEAFIWCISRTNKEISFLKNRAISIYKLSRTEYKKLAHFWNGVSVLGEFFFRTGCQFGVPGCTYPPKKYPSAPLPPGGW